MRDPWFPTALMLIVLLAAWLGIAGPLPDGVSGWIYKWQTLLAAGLASAIASVAAYIAFRNTSRTLRHNEELKRHERAQKHAAVRAILPLALSQVVSHAQESAHALKRLAAQCRNEFLPHEAAPTDLGAPLPSETLQVLREFIEYASVDVHLIESTVALIQVHVSRLNGIVQGSHDPTRELMVLQHSLERSILDAAIIHAGAEAAFRYARRQDDDLPRSISWQQVRDALSLMRFWDHEHPRLYEHIARSEARGIAPVHFLG